MTPVRLVPRVVRFGTAPGPWLVVCFWQRTLDVAAMACWPGLLAENCREAEGRRIRTAGPWLVQQSVTWQALAPQPAFSQVN